MKILKYFILALFICSVFSCVSVSTKSPRFIGDNDLFLKDNNWLMLKSEKNAFEEAKTDEEKERLIERFWKARDPDTFTEKNELRLSYEQNLIEARKDYPALDDSRRCVYLLYGKPDSKYHFTNETVSVFTPFMIRIHIEQGEIWRYNSQGQNFQVIFAKLDLRELQRAKDNYIETEQDFSSVSLYSSRFEILYVGLAKYINISSFIEDFFRGGFRLKTTSEILDDFKKSILNRAKSFYKGVIPKVKKEKYSHSWERGGIQALIHPFEIQSPQEAGISIWLSFGKDSLSPRKDKYLANLSLFCEIKDKDSNGKQIVYYQEDSIEYKLKKKEDYYYHFWGSLKPGKYKLILEIGENIGKRYKKFEVDIQAFDYSVPGLNVDFLVGKMFKDSGDRFKGKIGYFVFREGSFCPIFGSQYFKDDDDLNFRDDDDLIAIFNVAGFKKDNYGNPYVEFILLFVKGEIDAQGEFVPTVRVSSVLISRLEEDGLRYLGIRKIKIGEIVEKLKLPSGTYKVKLLIRDRMAGKEGAREFGYPIRIISAIADAKEYR